MLIKTRTIFFKKWWYVKKEKVEAMQEQLLHTLMRRYCRLWRLFGIDSNSSQFLPVWNAHENLEDPN